ncbi:MAG: PKD domain-containing protein, partial [Archangium sp.]
RPPVVTLAGLMEVNMGETVTVSGEVTDPDGDGLTVEWSQQLGPTVALSDAASAIVTFTAPNVDVTDVVRLTLTGRDSAGATASASVDVVIRNPSPVMQPGGGGGETMPKGCGCTSGFELFPLAALVFALRSRRKR